MATFTSSSTRTFSRIDLLTTQVKIVLRRTTTARPDVLTKIEEGVRKCYIKAVSVVAIDHQGLCRAQLELEIDWDEFNLQISRGKLKVAIDGWSDDTAIEIDELISLFMKVVRERQLSTEWRCTINPAFDFNTVCSVLDMRRAESIRWSGEPTDAWSSLIPELPELRASIRLGA